MFLALVFLRIISTSLKTRFSFLSGNEDTECLGQMSQQSARERRSISNSDEVPQPMLASPGVSYADDGSVGPRITKPFHCDMCDKAFSDAYGVRRHKKAEHENVTHACVCGRVYKYRSGFTQHLKSCSVHRFGPEKQ